MSKEDPIFLGIDYETTNFVNPALSARDPAQGRVCQVSLILMDQHGTRIDDDYCRYIIPDDWKIGEGSFKIHGITEAKCIAEGVLAKEAYAKFQEYALRADYIVAFNSNFDKAVAEMEAAALNMDSPSTPWVCSMRKASPYCKLGKFPSLVQAYKIICGKALPNAHDAQADNSASMEVFFASHEGVVIHEAPAPKEKALKATTEDDQPNLLEGVVEEPLVVLSEIEPEATFNIEAANKLLEKIRERAISIVVGDVTTAKGRKSIISAASNVAKTKVAIDNIGKELVEGQKREIAKIDAARKALRDGLDALKEEIRLPVTQWEEHRDECDTRIRQFVAMQTITDEDTVEQIQERLAEVERLIKFNWGEEYELISTTTHREAKEKIQAAINRRNDNAAKDAELVKLRAQQDEIAKKEREDKIASDAAEDATKKANLAAQKLIDDANAATAAANQRAADATKKAEDDQKKKQQVEEDDKKKREADTEHKKKINNEVIEDLIKSAGLVSFDREIAIKVLTAMVRKQIRNVTINY